MATPAPGPTVPLPNIFPKEITYAIGGDAIAKRTHLVSIQFLDPAQGSKWVEYGKIVRTQDIDRLPNIPDHVTVIAGDEYFTQGAHSVYLALPSYLSNAAAQFKWFLTSEAGNGYEQYSTKVEPVPNEQGFQTGLLPATPERCSMPDRSFYTDPTGVRHDTHSAYVLLPGAREPQLLTVPGTLNAYPKVETYRGRPLYSAEQFFGLSTHPSGRAQRVLARARSNNPLTLPRQRSFPGAQEARQPEDTTASSEMPKLPPPPYFLAHPWQNPQDQPPSS